jgi:transcriptional regulator with XRE-family HTH domain
VAVRKTEGRDKHAVAARLQLTRDALGKKQGEFAEAAGIKKNTYNQYETAKNLISLDEAHKLCDAHNLTLDWIYRGDQSNLRAVLADAIKAIRQARRT